MNTYNLVCVHCLIRTNGLILINFGTRGCIKKNFWDDGRVSQVAVRSPRSEISSKKCCVFSNISLHNLIIRKLLSFRYRPVFNFVNNFGSTVHGMSLLRAQKGLSSALVWHILLMPTIPLRLSLHAKLNPLKPNFANTVCLSTSCSSYNIQQVF